MRRFLIIMALAGAAAAVDMRLEQTARAQQRAFYIFHYEAWVISPTRGELYRGPLDIPATDFASAHFKMTLATQDLLRQKAQGEVGAVSNAKLISVE